MNVKTAKEPLNTLRGLLKSHNGILLTSDLAKLGIPRTYLSILLKNDEIERISQGVYSAANRMPDEMANLQARFSKAVFSHETALYLIGLTDRTPLFFSVTLPTGYNATALKAGGIKTYFIKRDLFLLGLISGQSPHGNEVKTYNPERTICDILRGRNRIDSQIINEALKRYARSNDRNIDLLYSYAGFFGVQKIIKETIEILL